MFQEVFRKALLSVVKLDDSRLVTTTTSKSLKDDLANLPESSSIYTKLSIAYAKELSRQPNAYISPIVIGYTDKCRQILHPEFPSVRWKRIKRWGYTEALYNMCIIGIRKKRYEPKSIISNARNYWAKDRVFKLLKGTVKKSIDVLLALNKIIRSVNIIPDDEEEFL